MKNSFICNFHTEQLQLEFLSQNIHDDTYSNIMVDLKDSNRSEADHTSILPFFNPEEITDILENNDKLPTNIVSSFLV